MSVIGIIIGAILLGVLVYLIVRNVIGIIQGVKARREYKKKNQVLVGDTPIDEQDYKKD